MTEQRRDFFLSFFITRNPVCSLSFLTLIIEGKDQSNNLMINSGEFPCISFRLFISFLLPSSFPLSLLFEESSYYDLLIYAH